MTRQRTIALCHAHAAEALKPWRKVPLPVQITDESHPNIARAIAGLADMTPERRAALEAEWD